MGKKDDWCSVKGLNNHKKGMYDKESKCTKICYSAFFTFSACIYLVCGGLSAERANNANKINADFDAGSLLGSDTLAYDQCKIPYFLPDGDYEDIEKA